MIALAVFAAAIRTGPAEAQQAIDARREYNVKAVNVYGFCRFVTWPSDSLNDRHPELVIGVCGSSRIEEALKEVARRKTVNQRKLKIVRCETAAELKACHVGFISRSLPRKEQEQLIEETGTASVMLVGEHPGFAEAGGIANFYISNGRVRFELNPTAAAERRLKLDAKLLSLGTTIRRPNGTASTVIR